MRPLPILVFATILLAGCSGKAAERDVLPSPSVSETDSPSPTPTEPDNTFVPKFHTHDYWAGRTSMVLFGPMKLDIGQDPLTETTINSNSVVMGATTFDTKTDGDDVNLVDKTDVVFQGTQRIDVLAKWTDTNLVPGLNFYYKPANTPSMTLLGPLENGKTAPIFLRQGWADMPHQLSLSRWKFKIEAFNPQTASMPMRASEARGSVEVTLTIFNGGERFIDPPHPYFFTGGPVRYAGEINRTFTNCVVANNTRVNPSQPQVLTDPLAYGCTLKDYGLEAPNIVPWETTKVLVDLYFNYTGQDGGAVARKLGLVYHAADGPLYRYPRAAVDKAGYAQYEIPVSEAMTDSPYASQSDWKFGVYPVTQDQRDVGGTFTGGLHIVVHAVKEGDSSMRGMGN